MELTESSIRDWLLKYAWLGDDNADVRRVNCIMAQGEWSYVDAQVERFCGMASGEEVNVYKEALEFALSALYECHAEPHLGDCPDGIKTAMDSHVRHETREAKVIGVNGDMRLVRYLGTNETQNVHKNSLRNV